MTVQLVSNDFQQLVWLIEQDDNFRTVAGRVCLVTGALEGAPRTHDVLPQLDLGGTPRGVAVEVVRRLAQCGQPSGS